MSSAANTPHPGNRIKTEVIPQRMSVTKAAQLMGVGRPALSNLLNGNSALSADMASRLEKAFKFPLKDLMDMQAQYEAAQAKLKEAPADTKSYVPPFLGIKANQLEQWVHHNISARGRLSVLLRTLVHSTGRALSKVDFPGNDDAERPGWDGLIESDEGTPWIPKGRSGWEFGVNLNVKAKADADFDKSIQATPKDECSGTTFVFVTPRRWAGKNDWIAEKKAKGIWKDVRAWDSSDLEQWIEQSLPAQAWFASETNLPANDVRSLDKCWADWANVSTPPLAGSLFSSSIDAAKRIVASRLSKPPERPVLLAADSTEEALAFLAQLFGEQNDESLASFRDRILVFDKPGTLPRLAIGAQTFIAVVFTREVERELAPYAKSMHSIVVYPRNAILDEPDIVLEPANYETFEKALEEMGNSRDEISRLAQASGRSLTVLRRQLSTVPGVRTPDWASNPQTAESLVPFFFVGAWNNQNETDKVGLTLLANGRSYDDLDRAFQSIIKLNDTPIWALGAFRGVISKIDLLFSIAPAITSNDLKCYFSLAKMVLGEDDPSLDLEEDQRWAASIHGKTREFSKAFREGISETLVLLAVHGRNLFKSQLGFDTESEAIQVIRELLKPPLITRVLEANDRDLPTYAEAAPDEFLSIIERDLASATPAVRGLLRPAGTGFFGHPSRTGLLWALEGLAWNPETLPRAALILANLSESEIKDNWVNKPINSLEAIFRAWMPQTSASHEVRVNLMKKLAEKFPNVAWKICVAQFGNHHQVGSYSHKPRWRTDGYGFGEPFSTWKPRIDFMREMVEMALTWNGHSLTMLCDLVERLHDLSDVDQARVWVLVKTWAITANDTDKAAMRDKIRVSTLSRRAAMQAKKSGRATGLAVAGKAAYAALEPSDVLDKHAWLFRENWVQESADEIEDIEKIDYHKRDERIEILRTEALREVWKQCGFEGIIELAKRGKASWTIGAILAKNVVPENELQGFLELALKPILEDDAESYFHKNLVAGALRFIPDNAKREAILNEMAVRISKEDFVRLLILAPYRKCTWKIVDTLAEPEREKYWLEVVPDWIHDSDTENNEGVERLVEAGRARAAFSCIRFHPEKLDAEILYRLFSKMAAGGADRSGEYMLDHYSVDKAFEHMSASPALTLDQKAKLEFAFIDVLAEPWGSRTGKSGIPHLELYIEANPEVCVQAITWAYKRKDGGIDPPEFQLSADSVQNMAGRGHKLLDALRRMPGHDDLGELKSDRLAKWVATVRKGCAELSRADIADLCIGKLLAHAPIGLDGVWPCEPVRNVLEEFQSESMMSGAHTGVYNSRGVVSRSLGEGGNQERQLAEKYRKWGQALQVSHPFMASKLLLSLAKTYEYEANREDTEVGIRRRLM